MNSRNNNYLTFYGRNIMWSKPEYTEMRFGFEVTMYIATK